ncbi:MAG: ubiquinol-cytochrome C chaperone family protein [Alphaproteobacteria bacterium]|uniref:ubiquinol-cytochrome C chaperone family protein n=1 Tax=Alphaproteobacteria TaxID=28211 RepID=UPI0032644E91
MFGRLFRRGGNDDAIPSALYGAIVAQARMPALYRDIGVADTVDGRFESVVLHMVLVLRRLGAGDEQMRAIGQTVFDQFCTEMDRSLREMGIGDLAVPKRMRTIGEVFYGRSAAFDTALVEGNAAALAESLARNIPAAEGREVAAGALAAYMIASDASLQAQSKAQWLASELAFADPATFLQDETSHVDQPTAGQTD